MILKNSSITPYESEQRPIRGTGIQFSPTFDFLTGWVRDLYKSVWSFRFRSLASTIFCVSDGEVRYARLNRGTACLRLPSRSRGRRSSRPAFGSSQCSGDDSSHSSRGPLRLLLPSTPPPSRMDTSGTQSSAATAFASALAASCLLLAACSAKGKTSLDFSGERGGGSRARFGLGRCALLVLLRLLSHNAPPLGKIPQGARGGFLSESKSRRIAVASQRQCIRNSSPLACPA